MNNNKKKGFQISLIYQINSRTANLNNSLAPEKPQ